MSSSDGEDGDVRRFLVFKGGRISLHYKIGGFPGAVAGEVSEVILIAELGGRFIAAFPGSVWHRKVSKRKLERTILGKAIAVDVAGAYLVDLETPAAEVSVRVWVGILGMEAENLVEFPCPETANYRFGDSAAPYAEALVKVADDQFAFTTAESGLGGDNMFKRMSAVESGIAELRGLLKDALKAGGAGSLVADAKARAGPLGSRAKAASSPPGRVDLSGLDRSTVAAARTAGVTDQALGEMARLIGAKRTRGGESGLDAMPGED